MAESPVTEKTVLDEMMALPATSLSEPSLPPQVSVSEALLAHAHGNACCDTLTTRGGLKEGVLERLPIAAGIAREASSKWLVKRFATPEARSTWESKYAIAFDEREALLAAMDNAFHDRPDLLGVVSKIRDGAGDDDLIQDLSDSVELGKQYRALLLEVKYDETRLETLRQLAVELGRLRAQSQVARESESPEKIMRDRAFTYLENLVAATRRAAGQAFYNDAASQRNFQSKYERRLRARRKAKQEAQTTQKI